jgi:hypothetical protein
MKFLILETSYSTSNGGIQNTFTVKKMGKEYTPIRIYLFTSDFHKIICIELLIHSLLKYNFEGYIKKICIYVWFILSRVYGSMTNNNGFLNWMIGFINTSLYNLS